LIEGNKVLAVIPARGGSKGIPRKNIRQVTGKPLIAYTIEAAFRSRYLDKIVVSSEDQEILGVARECGAEPLVRPAELAEDDTAGIEPVLHAIEACSGYDYVVLLQPTSPLRISEDIDEAIQVCLRLEAPACVSVCEASQSPFWMYSVNENMQLSPVIPGKAPSRRQDLKTVYLINGAVYVAEIEWLALRRDFISGETVAYVMPLDRSLDIDAEKDLQLFEKSLNKN
jgi:CMP-N,N'-diacetyllegionaminic acid synthase